MDSKHQNAESSNLLEMNNVVNLMNPQLNTFSVEEHSEVGDSLKPQKLSSNMPNKFVYIQDIVKCSKREGMLGIVMEVSGDPDSDSEGSMTDVNDSEDEEQHTINGGNDDDDTNNSGTVGSVDNVDSLPDDQVRITWIDGSETKESIGDITAVDRTFVHGDIVASVSNPTGQLGLITDVDIRVDLLSASGELIKDVSSRDLKHISQFAIGDFVVHGPWLGRVDEVLFNVTVLFDDGSVCKVVKADPSRLRPVSKLVVDDAVCPYYPGQRVRAVSSSLFKTSRWLSGLWKANRLESTVVKVETASVFVYWKASDYINIGANSEPIPPEEQNPKNLTLLSCFSHVNWQLADWCLLQLPTQTLSSANNLSETGEGDESGFPHTYGHVSSCKDRSRLVKSNHLVTLDLETNSGNTPNGSTKTSANQNSDGNCQFHNNDSLSLAKTKSGQNGTESNDLPENCSCSSTSLRARTQESWPIYRKKLRKVLFKREKKTHKRDENFERALSIVSTVTKVNVAWQDGKIDSWLPSTSLIPIQTPNDNEFFPEQYVVEKASNEGEGSKTNRIGVVMRVNSEERTVWVRWLKEVSKPEEAQRFDSEEVVSVYDLEAHPDYDYCYGDVVVRLPPVSGDSTISENALDAGERPPDAKGMDDDSSGKDVDKDKEDQHASNDEACKNLTCLPWVGNITDLEEGDIEVTWVNGEVSKVGPHEIYVVGRDGDPIDGGSEVSDGGASWETVDDDEMHTLGVNEKEDDLQNLSSRTIEKSSIISQEDHNAGRSGPLAVYLAALDFIARLATGIFNQATKQLNSSGSDQVVSNERDKPKEYYEFQALLGVSENILSEEDKFKALNTSDDLNAKDMSETVEGEHDMAAMEVGMATVDISVTDTSFGEVDDHTKFKHFDITETPLDHHFRGHGTSGTGGRKWVKKVQQEWSILKQNLPDAIYVRVFEDRMDLLRAVIVGAYGTPYQDGLFFFDFYLPPEFPQVPPLAHYHSGGLRVNPNLYVDGKVCLSLLNTWTGKGNEVWDPSSSSILQVVISLQGLVLNSKPYFNEAGYEKQIGTLEGEKNSLPYNENTYLLNLKSMMYLLRRPPMHFEDFVKEHFHRRGHYILKACEAYYNGSCSIESLTSDSCLNEKSSKHSCSAGFKLTLMKILPRLIPALKEVGADCHQFEYLINPENFPGS